MRQDIVLYGVIIATLIGLPSFFASNSALIVLTQMAITVVFALSYNMVLGQAGMLSFGHAVYMGVGGFAAVHVMNGALGAAVPLIILPFFGGLFSLGVATIVGSFSTRKGGTSFAMISLGIVELVASFSIVIVAFFRGGGMLWDRTRAPHLFGVDFADHLEVYFLVVAWMIVSVAVMFGFTCTPIGRLANAVRENPERVEFVGYSARWVRFYSFCGAGFFAGVAGALSAIAFEIASAENLTLQASGTILLVTFLGGVGVFYGPIFGAIAFTLLQTVLSFQTELWELYLGVLFLVMVMFCPTGLAGLLALHVMPFRMGRAGDLVLPYVRVVVPALVGLWGVMLLLEMVYHLRSAAVGETQAVIFGMVVDTDSVLPWVVGIAFAVFGAWGAKSQAPVLREAWQLVPVVR